MSTGFLGPSIGLDEAVKLGQRAAAEAKAHWDNVLAAHHGAKQPRRTYTGRRKPQTWREPRWRKYPVRVLPLTPVTDMPYGRRKGSRRPYRRRTYRKPKRKARGAGTTVARFRSVGGARGRAHLRRMHGTAKPRRSLAYGLPKTMLAKVKFVQSVVVGTAGSPQFGEIVFVANLVTLREIDPRNPRDPFNAGGGTRIKAAASSHIATGFDEMARIYNEYKVVSATVAVTMPEQNANTANNVYWGVKLASENWHTRVDGVTTDFAMERRYLPLNKKLRGGALGGDSRVMQSAVAHYKAATWHKKGFDKNLLWTTISAEPDVAAYTATSTQRPRWFVYLAGPPGSTNQICHAQIEIDYVVAFRDAKVISEIPAV